MKTNRSAIESTSDHRVNCSARTLLRRGLAAAMKFATPACVLMAASLANAGQPFTSTPSAASQVASFQQAQNSMSTTASSNQALMSQLIGQLNQRQLQSQITAANFAAQRPMYLPQQTITVRHGK